MAAVANQQIGHFIQRPGDVEFGNRATRAAALFLALFHDDGWAIIFLGQTAGHKANNAGLKLPISRDDDRRFGIHHLFGHRAQLAGQALSLTIKSVQQLRLLARGGRVGRDQQLGGFMRMGQPTGGVDARPQGKPDTFRGQLIRGQSAHV